MAVNLKNGIKLTTAEVNPEVADATGTLRFEDDPLQPNGKGIAVTSASSMVDKKMAPTVAAFRANGRFASTGVPAADLQSVDVRYMQLAQINFYTATYAGKRSAEGMVDYAYTGNLTGKFLLDCLTNSQATDGVNRPFYNNEDTARQGASFFPSLNDTPRANIALNLYNGKTGRENYLWNFESSTFFVTYAVFKHKDGTIEPIEGCSWQLDREIELRWKDGKPERKTFKSSLVIKDKHVTPAKSPQIAKLLTDSSGLEIINVATNKALGQMRSSPASIRFDELPTYWDGFVEDFWT
ncbi:hypothetical protein sos41_43260 [Alphaproteobacteria bacterium SO-S41]|nr:hypothetical protein sos41_43260 [Alphaproteobacteria bacterium SO-S41]